MPIFLLNVDTRLVSKNSTECLKNVFPSLISSNQIVYVNSRFISEDERFFKSETLFTINRY